MAVRARMWVMSDQGIGIVNALDVAKGAAEVHLVDGKGETARVLHGVAVSTLRQAYVDEIPEARVKHMTPEAWAALGYTRRGEG